MILSKTAIWLLCVLLLLSVFLANLINLLATDHKYFTQNKNVSLNYTEKLGQKYGKITDTTENIMWFLQVSFNLVSNVINLSNNKDDALILYDVPGVKQRLRTMLGTYQYC